jgi:hypothetical protein
MVSLSPPPCNYILFLLGCHIPEATGRIHTMGQQYSQVCYPYYYTPPPSTCHHPKALLCHSCPPPSASQSANMCKFNLCHTFVRADRDDIPPCVIIHQTTMAVYGSIILSYRCNTATPSNLLNILHMKFSSLVKYIYIQQVDSVFIPQKCAGNIARNTNNLLIVDFIPEGNMVYGQAWNVCVFMRGNLGMSRARFGGYLEERS